MSLVNSLQIPLLPESSLQRIAPEPKSGVSAVFSSVLDGVGGAIGGVAGGAMGGINGEFATMINEQIKWQMQMQRVSMLSNVEKSKHETQMAAIRNIRAG